MLFLGLHVYVNAQNMDFSELIQQITETMEEEYDIELLTDQLQTIYEHKIQLNSCEKEDLEALFFLSDKQIEEILYYRYKNQGFKTLFELQLVPFLDMTDIRNLLPFFELGEFKRDSKSLFQLWKYSKSSMLIQFDRVIEKKQGYRPDYYGNTDYTGDPLHHFVKYYLNAEDRISVSFSAEKDAGERLYDFVTASVLLKKTGIFRQIALGDYQLGFGQGLAMNQLFSRGKVNSLNSSFARTQGIKKYSSLNESNFLRGLAVEIEFFKIRGTLFLSSKRMDADTTGNQVKSIYLTGYHRTSYELYKKNTFRQSVIGTELNYTFHKLQVSYLHYFVKFNTELVKGDLPYQHFNFQGNHQFNQSLNYRAIAGKFHFFGEFALSDFTHTAFLNGLILKTNSQLDLSLIYRNYSPAYQSFFSNAFREGGKVNNEKGMYFGFQYTGLKNWNWMGYVDGYQFPWLRFQTEGPTAGVDMYLNTTYTGMRNIKINQRVKYEFSELSSKLSFRADLNWNYDGFRYKNGMEINYLSSLTKGWTLYQDIGFDFMDGKFSVDLRYCQYDIQEYANKIYLYEKDVYRNFSVPVLYGKGARFYVLGAFELNRSNKIWIKYGLTKFADGRSEISSGNEQIRGKVRSEIKVEFSHKL